jgi:hypothetical protein
MPKILESGEISRRRLTLSLACELNVDGNKRHGAPCKGCAIVVIVMKTVNTIFIKMFGCAALFSYSCSSIWKSLR